MDAEKQALARRCLKASETGSMAFPEIVAALMQGGFESYEIDFRRSAARYYTGAGESVEVPTHKVETPIAAAFNATTIQSAITEAQTLAPGYTYIGFCQKVAAAGCAGYIVSFIGRRALYFGRTAETHVEYFPD